MLFWIFIGLWVIGSVLISRSIYKEEKRKGTADALLGYGSFLGPVAIMIGLALAIVFLLVGFFGNMFTTLGDDYLRLEEKKVTLISAMSNGSSVEGNVFLVQTSDVIKYVKGTEDTGYRIDFEQAYNSVIFEDGKDRPYLAEMEAIFDFSWWAPWTPEAGRSGFEYHFHVPEGTVIQSYEVDITK